MASDSEEELAVMAVLALLPAPSVKLKPIFCFKTEPEDSSLWEEMFRFSRSQICKLKELFKSPAELGTSNRYITSAEEALCIYLSRMTYPNRLCDLKLFTGRCEILHFLVHPTNWSQLPVLGVGSDYPHLLSLTICPSLCSDRRTEPLTAPLTGRRPKDGTPWEPDLLHYCSLGPGNPSPLCGRASRHSLSQLPMIPTYTGTMVGGLCHLSIE
ncbi:hypothetical protein BC829DRAFT_446324 [Chytridium lagenaria]|nr:hypothetical protein BC829DRAFT_446324 [Chytridium lagenaria]